MLKKIRYESIHPTIRQLLHGLLWPEHWLEHMRQKAREGKPASVPPSALLRSPGIVCDDVLVPLAMLYSFALCSPPLAVIISALVVTKLSIWAFAIQQFCGMLSGEFKESAGGRIGPSGLVSVLSNACIPLVEVLGSAFESILLYSLVFVLFVYWDAASGISWEIAVALMLYAVLLVGIKRVKMSSRSKPLAVSSQETVSAIWTV